MDTINCADCGKPTAKKAKNQKYCRPCYREKHRPLIPRVEKICVECSTPFQGTKKDKYCTAECRKVVKNRKNAEYRKLPSLRMTCCVCSKRFTGKMKDPLCSKQCRDTFFKSLLN